MKSSRPGDPCRTVNRPSQHHPNPAPGSTPEAAAAAKKDAGNRDGGVVGALKAAYNKMMSTAPTPTPQPNAQSAAVMADKKDQAAQMTPDAK